jgi:VanZ family protein
LPEDGFAVKSLLQVDPRLQKKYWWLVVGIVWWTLIAVFSLISPPQISVPDNTDKLYHAFSYAVLMAWWLQLFPHPRMRLLLAAVFILFGAGIEMLQSFHPLRYYDVWDMLANSVGVILAWLLGRTGFDQLLYHFEKRFL